MSILNDIRQQKHLRAAEGYLDLILVFADRWPPSDESRNRIAQRALDELSQVTDRTRQGHVNYLRGLALRAMEDYRGAIDPLTEALRIEPDNTHIYLALGWCFKRIGRLDLAIQALEDALEFGPDEAILHYNLACYWSLAENARIAIQYLQQSFDLDSHYRELVSAESDFDPIRRDPGFQMLTSVIV